MKALQYLAAAAESLKGQTENAGGNGDLAGTVGLTLNVVYVVVGVIAVIFIIIGGINYTMSQGDPGKVKKAKKDTVLYGIIGLIIALLAFAITAFVMNAMEGNV